jgi:hypothetical protein
MTSFDINRMCLLAVESECARIRLHPWELRVLDYRIFYDFEPAVDESAEPEVVILAIGVKTGNRLLIGDEEHEL